MLVPKWHFAFCTSDSMFGPGLLWFRHSSVFLPKTKNAQNSKMDNILCLVTVWWLLQRNPLSVQLHPHLQCSHWALTCSGRSLQYAHCVHSVCIVQGLGVQNAKYCCQRMQMQCIPGLIPFYIIQSFPKEINFSPRSAMFVGFSPEQCSTLLTPQA